MYSIASMPKELNSGDTRHGYEPAPSIKSNQDNKQRGIQQTNEAHHGQVLLVYIVVPYWW